MAIKYPLNAPAKHPVAKAINTIKKIENSLCAPKKTTVATRARTEPAETSIPDVKITRVAPTAAIPIIEIQTMRLIRLAWLQNPPFVPNDKIRTIRMINKNNIDS